MGYGGIYVVKILYYLRAWRIVGIGKAPCIGGHLLGSPRGVQGCNAALSLCSAHHMSWYE